MNEAYAAVNFTTSTPLRPSPTGPPIVPLIPDIDLINAIGILFLYAPHPRGHPQYSALKYRTLYIYGMQLLTSDVNPIVDLTIRSTSQS